MLEWKVTEVESFTTISSNDYALQFSILVPVYAVAVAEPALSIEVFVYLEVCFRKPGLSASVRHTIRLHHANPGCIHCEARWRHHVWDGWK